MSRCAVLAAVAAVTSWVAYRAVRRLRRPSTLKLVYFDFPGLGDHLRLTLAVGGIRFEDERLPPDERGYAAVARLRESGQLPFGQVPVAQIDGATYAQSNALLRYFGRKGRLYPEGEMQLQCDMVLEAWADVDARITPQYYQSVLARSPINGKPQVPLSEAQQAEVARHLNTDALPTMLSRIARVLHSMEGPWFCGQTLTVADLKSFVVVTGLRSGSYARGIDPAVLDGCPALLEHATRVAAIPAVRRWVSR
jgi:glutathione S-transferase